MRLFYAVLRAMQLGVKVDPVRRAAIQTELKATIAECDTFIQAVLGHPLNVRSSPQMASLFYGDLGQKPVMSRAKKNQPSHVSCDDESLQIVAGREPALRPLIDKILHRRGMSVLQSTFIDARVGEDGRMRCSYNICGTETYRLASSQDAFGSGLNLMTIPDAKTKSAVKAGKRGEHIPNVKTMFVPDEGFTFFNGDLKRADLNIVAWEAGDEVLKQMLREQVEIHIENGKVLGCNPELAKSFIHGTDYGGSARTMAITCGVTVHTAENYQSRWFSAHPGIKRWHVETEKRLRATREVRNAFGFRRHYFGRIDGILPEALAWIPQSTVGIVINKAWVNLYEQLPIVQVLLQNHDALAGQYPTAQPDLLNQTETLCKITVPYPDPLIIPISFKSSPVSWGDCV